MIAACLKLGISKRALLNDYYLSELPLVLKAWTRLHGGDSDAETVDPMTFLGTGGERLDG